MQELIPAIIDRAIFFDNPEITGAKISPNGEFMSFIKPLNGVRNIWVKRTNDSFDNAIPVTADTKRPIPGYFWSWDSQYIIFVQDKGGDENYHVYAVAPAEANGGLPDARNLTPIDGIRAFIYSVPKKNPDLLYIGINDRDQSWHDLVMINISTGEMDRLFENSARITSWTFDLEGQLRLATRATPEAGTEILKVNGKELEVIFECPFGEFCDVIRFHPDGQRCYLVHNKGAEKDLTGLYLFNIETGAIELQELDPENQVDFGEAMFSGVTEELVITVYEGDKPRYYFKDKAFQEDYEYLQNQSDGVISIISRTLDERHWLVQSTSDVDPGAVYLFNRDSKALAFQYRPRPKLPVDQLSPRKPVRYKSLDDLEIPAYLTLPKGLPEKDLPTILLIHGGPWYRDVWGYDAFAQFLANRGYAVLQPNFRSSTGYGKHFLNAGNNEWGRAMQDDISAGVKYLVNEGISDPQRIGIMGGSYGGYATLAGLAFTPDIFSAGVSIVGPSNLITLLQSIPSYWESARMMFYKRVGSLESEEGIQQLKERSPLFHAKKIKAPLLVVQGANDPRVKQAESDQIVVAMRELGLAVEYIVAPDEGHGFAHPENNMAFIAVAEQFLAKHLKGRYQEAIPEKIAERLDRIKVDIEKVALAED